MAAATGPSRMRSRGGMRDMVSVGGLFLIIINAEYLDHMCRLDHSFVTNLVMTIDVKGSMEYYRTLVHS